MHTIRLRRPWLRYGNEDRPTKVDAPDLAPGPEANCSTVRYDRSFNQPTGITENDRVLLAIESFAGQKVEIKLNDQIVLRTDRLSDSLPFSVEINDKLVPHNVLSIHLTGTENEPAVLDGEVMIQIHSE